MENKKIEVVSIKKPLCPKCGGKTKFGYIPDEDNIAVFQCISCGEIIRKYELQPLERIPDETKIDKTSTREVYDKFYNEYTYIADYASVLMDKHFPKGESKERSKALVFNGELIHYMMLVMNGVVERLTDEIKTIDKGVDTKSQSGEREALLKTDRYICKKCALGLVIETSGIRHWRCPSCSSLNYEENYLENRLEKEFDSKLSESKKECIQKALDDFGGWFNEPGEEKEDYKGFRKHMESKYKLV